MTTMNPNGQPHANPNAASNVNPSANNADHAPDNAKVHAEIAKVWNKLSPDDIKLYDNARPQFFAKLKEKQNVSKEDGEKRLQEIEKSCGCGSAKMGTVKAA